MTFYNADIAFKCNGNHIQTLYGVDLSKISVPVIGDTVKLDYYNKEKSSSYGTFKVIDREFRYCHFTEKNFYTLNIIIKVERLTN